MFVTPVTPKNDSVIEKNKKLRFSDFFVFLNAPSIRSQGVTEKSARKPLKTLGFFVTPKSVTSLKSG